MEAGGIVKIIGEGWCWWWWLWASSTKVGEGWRLLFSYCKFSKMLITGLACACRVAEANKVGGSGGEELSSASMELVAVVGSDDPIKN